MLGTRRNSYLLKIGCVLNRMPSFTSQAIKRNAAGGARKNHDIRNLGHRSRHGADVRRFDVPASASSPAPPRPPLDWQETLICSTSSKREAPCHQYLLRDARRRRCASPIRLAPCATAALSWAAPMKRAPSNANATTRATIPMRANGATSHHSGKRKSRSKAFN